jgi:hypothetical protein
VDTLPMSYKQGVTGSSPVVPTTISPSQDWIAQLDTGHLSSLNGPEFHKKFT